MLQYQCNTISLLSTFPHYASKFQKISLKFRALFSSLRYHDNLQKKKYKIKGKNKSKQKSQKFGKNSIKFHCTRSNSKTIMCIKKNIQSSHCWHFNEHVCLYASLVRRTTTNPKKICISAALDDKNDVNKLKHNNSNAVEKISKSIALIYHIEQYKIYN